MSARTRTVRHLLVTVCLVAVLAVAALGLYGADAGTPAVAPSADGATSAAASWPSPASTAGPSSRA